MLGLMKQVGCVMVHVDVEFEMFLALAKLFSVRAGIADIKLSPLAS